MKGTSPMRYAYTGPLTSATLDGKDTLLHPGQEVELDPESNFTKTLSARGWLTPVKGKKSAGDASPPAADAGPTSRRSTRTSGAPKPTSGSNQAAMSADTSKPAASTAKKES